MPDEPHTDSAMPGEDAAKPSGGFDDDRLLACALGLEDDPELVAAAAADAELGARLETVRAQAAAVGARVAAAVPAPPEDYADLRSPRWAELGEFFEAPAPKPARSRSSRWLRVLAPAVVVVLAVAIGAALVSTRGGGRLSLNGSVSSEASKAAPMAVGSQDGATAAPTLGSVTTPVVALTDQAKRFATVVVARARKAAGGFQQFAVLRDLKGVAPDLLRLRVGDAPADAGKLHVLLLDPLSARAWPTPAATSQAYNEPPPLISVSPAAATIAGSTPVPSPSASAGAGPSAAPSPAAPGTTTPSPPADLSTWAQSEPTRTFGYHGQVALAEELPPGTDVASLSVP
jgi:hypothetical protein